MLRITMNTSASSAKKYYSEWYYQEGSATLDYYAGKDEVPGRWGGKGAEYLGLAGAMRKTDFAALCDNLHPTLGTTLTGRKNANRTVGYDFTFSANKSVSLALQFGNDADKQDILDAFDKAVAETMADIERGMQARVRANGSNENRLTGNIVYGAFTHFTTRPVDGVADPHLHSHCFVFNATYDDTEEKWKAGQFRQIKQDAPYYEAAFQARFAHKLRQLGYGITRTEHGFELKGVTPSIIERFSRRTKEIEEYAAANNITDAAEKSAIGAKTREAKRKALTPQQQEAAWRSRLSPEELASLQQLKSHFGNGGTPPMGNTAQKALQYALAHHLERKSVASDKEILATAIKSVIGTSTPEAVHRALEGEGEVLSVEKDLRRFLTTKEALREEKQLIARAVQSKNSVRPLNPNYEPQNPILNTQQRKAVMHALSSSDGITIITGKAGTGKTTLMQEVKRGIEAAGKHIYSYAPSSEASRGVQRKEGFDNADTVARLITDKLRHAELKHQVIWIDEAGMLSNRDMNDIMAIAQAQGARVILSGDTKQHTSVLRGDALRILQEEAGIRPITIDKIQRQQTAAYREAVGLFAAGKTEKGMASLDKMGAIHEITDGDTRTQAIADEYYQSAYGGARPKQVLVVSPTHAEAGTVTRHIRHTLKEHGVVEEAEQPYTRLKNLQFTEAQKQQPESYQPGQQVVFHQHSKGIRAGERLSIAEVLEQEVKLSGTDGNLRLLPLAESKKFSVYETQEIGLSVGDTIRITQNGKSEEGKHLFNGTSYRIEGMDDAGIHLSNGATIAKEFGHIAYGYVSTSHASQGKTADKVIISESTATLRAASMEQFYVSVSRGREAVSIYTDDKAELTQAVSQSSARLSASELLREKQKEEDRQRASNPKQQEPEAMPPSQYQRNPASYGFSPTIRTEQEYTR